MCVSSHYSANIKFGQPRLEADMVHSSRNLQNWHIAMDRLLQHMILSILERTSYTQHAVQHCMLSESNPELGGKRWILQGEDRDQPRQKEIEERTGMHMRFCKYWLRSAVIIPNKHTAQHVLETVFLQCIHLNFSEILSAGIICSHFIVEEGWAQH